MFNRKKNGPQSPRFFCESCGAEVPREARACPGCGRSFASVRCPSCGFSGGEALFKGGCPVCGYSSGESAGDTRENPRRAPGFPSGALPFWVYILTAAAFTAVLAALLLRIFR